MQVAPPKTSVSLLLALAALRCAALAALCLPRLVVAAQPFRVLQPAAFADYIARFNAMEDENVTNFVCNARSWAWLQKNVPLFECPDAEVEEIYYFRWWSLRKHLCQTPQGFVFTEFLTRRAPISSALGHHLLEGRWLCDPIYLDDYAHYWLLGQDGRIRPDLHKYSDWLAYALYQRFLVTGDRKFLVSLLDPLVQDYLQWERERRLPTGLFWQYDVRDAMEESISGSRTNKNLRPTLNSYMFGNAQAIAAIARLAGNTNLALAYDRKASELRRLTQATLWDPEAIFFKVRLDNGQLSDAREEIGFIPWYFELPEPGHEAAWAQFTDPAGFYAPYGITTAERRHPRFRSHGCCHCEWDGAVWPFATSQTLTALANVLRDYPLAAPKRLVAPERSGGGSDGGQAPVTSRDYFEAFLTYVHSQHANGKPYIGEYLDETTGQWFNGKEGRSRYYNHSTFADLLITGVIGLRPRADDTVEVFPLLPEGKWDWFCLEGVKYHGRMLTIIWDRDGARYGRGRGLRVLADGKEIARSEKIRSTIGKMQ